jgi:hypothetical protein
MLLDGGLRCDDIRDSLRACCPNEVKEQNPVTGFGGPNAFDEKFKSRGLRTLRLLWQSNPCPFVIRG